MLKGERDALLKLIQSMRKEYEAVQSAKGAQDDELRRLKERMLLGVSDDLVRHWSRHRVSGSCLKRQASI